MSDQWMARLSEYLDGELGAADAAALGTHLASCGSCRATLEELRRVVERAHTLDNRPPSRDLWPGIASRIGLAPTGVASLAAHRARRRFAFTLPELMAAGVALVLFSAGGAWLLITLRSSAPTPAALAPTPTTAVYASAAGARGDQRYAVQVADLERALERGRGRLDTGTVRVIEKNLGIIDRAIRDAQSALAADPANVYLNMHLAQEMRRKLELLRQAAALTGAQG